MLLILDFYVNLNITMQFDFSQPLRLITVQQFQDPGGGKDSELDMVTRCLPDPTHVEQRY